MERRSIVSTPNPATQSGDYDVLKAAAAVSANSVWAVGYTGNASADADRSLIEHWNGSVWSVVGGAPGYGEGYLFGATASSATGVWVVGSVGGVSFAEKYNGARWIQVSTPNVGTSNNAFQAAAANSGNVWAVGEWYQATSPFDAQTLAEECVACS